MGEGITTPRSIGKQIRFGKASSVHGCLRAMLAVALCLMVGVADAAQVEVNVQGIDDELRDNALELLSLAKLSKDRELSEAQIRRLHGRAAEEIKRALQPFGFYQAEVKGRLEQREDQWVAVYTVDPGPPVVVDSVDVNVTGEGADDQALQRARREFPLRKGERLRHPQYEKGKARLQKAALERGYFDARFTAHRIAVDTEAHTADVRLHLDSGPRYRFGEVEFEAEEISLDLLQRLVPFEPGDKFHSARLLDLQNALSDTDYFELVEVTPLVDEAEQRRVPIKVLAKARKRTRYSVGAGYGTDSGPRITLGLLRRYVNRRGHRLRGEVRLSEIRSGVDVQYLIPTRNPRTDYWFLRGEFLHEDTDVSNSDKGLLSVGREHVEGHWTHVYALRLLREKFEIADQDGTARLFMPTASWVRLKADNFIDTRHGSRYGLELRGALEDFVSNASFLQARLHTKWIRALDDHRLLLRGELGTTLTSDFSDLPPSVRFFAGGDQSVRGYGYNELGPTDSDGDVVGGEHLVVASAEYEYRFKPKWAAAVFYDVGNALTSASEALAKGAGAGLRWKSPVGWIRVDLARALSLEGDPWRLHVTLGPDL